MSIIEVLTLGILICDIIQTALNSNKKKQPPELPTWRLLFKPITGSDRLSVCSLCIYIISPFCGYVKSFLAVRQYFSHSRKSKKAVYLLTVYTKRLICDKYTNCKSYNTFTIWKPFFRGRFAKCRKVRWNLAKTDFFILKNCFVGKKDVCWLFLNFIV